MRLIDADALKEDYRMADDCKDCKTNVRDCEYDHVYTKMDFCGWLDDAPTLDVVPVRRGKWIPHREKSREYIGTVLVYVTYDYWFCDTCGYRVENGQPMYNFCPNCGARMEDSDG